MPTSEAAVGGDSNFEVSVELERLCNCGCGESIAHRAKQAEYLDESHRKGAEYQRKNAQACKKYGHTTDAGECERCKAWVRRPRSKWKTGRLSRELIRLEAPVETEGRLSDERTRLDTSQPATFTLNERKFRGISGKVRRSTAWTRMPRRRDQSEEIVTTSNATANERLEKWEATEPAEEAATFLKARERRQAALKRIAERPGSWRSRRKVEIGSTIDEGTEVTKASEEIVISAEPTGEERGALERAEVAA